MAFCKRFSKKNFQPQYECVCVCRSEYTMGANCFNWCWKIKRKHCIFQVESFPLYVFSASLNMCRCDDTLWRSNKREERCKCTCTSSFDDFVLQERKKMSRAKKSTHPCHRRSICYLSHTHTLVFPWHILSNWKSLGVFCASFVRASIFSRWMRCVRFL